MRSQKQKSVKTKHEPKNKPPQPGEQSPIAPHSSNDDSEGSIEKQGNVEPQQG